MLADYGLLPKPPAKLDVDGTPRPVVIVSPVFYSLFALLTFRKLVVAGVLLYSLPFFLEFGALIRLRKIEPSLRGAFGILPSRGGVAVLAALPMIILIDGVGVSFEERKYGLRTIIGATVAAAAGPVMYRLARHRRTSYANWPMERPNTSDARCTCTIFVFGCRATQAEWD